jgi:adenosylcobyric acid synthase
MLGRVIRDPFGMETREGEMEGLGLLDVKTVLMKDKRTFQVKAIALHGPVVQTGEILSAYEIHMGETERGPSLPAFKIIERLSQKEEIEEGAVSPEGMVWGTYLHGLFENDGFRRQFIERVRERKGRSSNSGVGETGRSPLRNYQAFKEREYDKLALALREALDIRGIYRTLGIDELPA